MFVSCTCEPRTAWKLCGRGTYFEAKGKLPGFAWRASIGGIGMFIAKNDEEPESTLKRCLFKDWK